MRIAMALGLVFASSLPAHAQTPSPATIEVVGASTFAAPVGHILDDRLRVRIRDAQGRPLPGVNVEFGVRIGGMYFGGQTWPYGKYGVFLTGDLPSTTERHFALTSADGVATSLPYRVTYESEGAWANSFPGNGTTLRADFNIARGAGAGPVALPALSIPALLGLVSGLVVLTVAFRRRRSPPRA
jgi:hypothetical protein